MHETQVTNKRRAGERAEADHPARRISGVDAVVLAFVAFTLVLMPILAGGPGTDHLESNAGSFSVQERQALADSRGDAAASAAAEKAADRSSSAAPMVRGANGKLVDDKTREAIDEASRGDAAARGSVAADYNEAGGRH